MPFANNSFCLLGIAPASRLDDAVEAKDDAVFDGRLDAIDADKAMRLVGDPRLRLEAELGWPLDAGDLADPGLPKRLASQPIGSTAPDAPLAHMLLLSRHIATGRLKADAKRVIQLAELWQAIRPETITQLVNNARTKACIPLAAPDQVADALNRRRDESARDLLASLDAPEAAGQVLADAVQRCLANSDPLPFLSDLVHGHNANSEAALQALEEEFDRIEKAVRAVPDKAFSQLSSLEDALERWDRISQPVQLLEQYRGHEEGRSLVLGRRLRGLAVEMTNEHNQPLFSDSLVRSLLGTFPELEGLAAALRNDQQALAPMVAAAVQTSVRRDAGPRRAAPAVARHSMPPRPERRKGWKGWFWALAVVLIVAFLVNGEDSRSRPSSGRDVSEYGSSYSPPVYNPPTTPAPVSPAASNPAPPTIRKVQLAKPPQAQGRVLSDGEILYCLHHKRVIETLEPDVRSDTQVANFNIIVGDYNARCSNYQYYDPDMTAAVSYLDSEAITREARALLTSWIAPPTAPPTALAPTRPAAPAPVVAPALTETMPGAGYGQLLNANEILYCLNQRNRLGALNNLSSSPSQFEAFKKLRSDFDSRCSNYRYDQRDMTAAQQAVNTTTAHRQALEMLRKIDDAAPSSVPSPESSTSGDALTEALRAAGVPAGEVVPEPADLRDPSVARSAQARLRDLGFLPAGGVDGRFGRGSATALRNFKASRGLPADDVWDYPTQEELFR